MLQNVWGLKLFINNEEKQRKISKIKVIFVNQYFVFGLSAYFAFADLIWQDLDNFAYLSPN